MFKSKLLKLAYAITIAEGWLLPEAGSQYPEGSPSYRHHNPGNIRESILQVGTDNGFAVFDNDIEGFVAIVLLLWGYVHGVNKDLQPDAPFANLIATYTGLNEGSAEFSTYAEIVCPMTGIKLTDPISSIV